MTESKKVEQMAENPPKEDEKAVLLERLKEIEEELFSLLKEEEKRSADYEKKVVNMEVRKIEEDLKKEAEELKGDYPEFEVEEELKNPVFVSLVNQGLPMRVAYEALNLEKIKEKGSKEAEERAVRRYRKNAFRPEENGIGKGGGGVLKSGVYALSKKDRAELAKRAKKGEIITFN